jgi:hypothetical protein
MILDWERWGLVKTRRAAGPTGQQVVVRVVDLDRVIANRPDRAPPSDVAALQAEIKYLRERLTEVTAERENLLRQLLEIARGARRR